MTTRALVLGGGGLAGIAWATGVLAAWADRGISVLDADRIIGTSAGSTVAAQLASGLPLSDLYQRQTDPARQTPELVPDPEAVARVMEEWRLFDPASIDPAAFVARAGELALTAKSVPEAARREVIASRLPVHDWPTSFQLLIPAVDTRSGAARVFTADSGVSLVDAVAASSAVPGVWPPVSIEDTRYMDGGVRSATNADLAEGCDRVLILAPTTDPASDQHAISLAAHARVEIVAPDENSLAAFGPNVLDPSVRAPAARAGYDQGVATADLARRVWSPE